MICASRNSMCIGKAALRVRLAATSRLCLRSTSFDCCLAESGFLCRVLVPPFSSTRVKLSSISLNFINPYAATGGTLFLSRTSGMPAPSQPPAPGSGRGPKRTPRRCYVLKTGSFVCLLSAFSCPDYFRVSCTPRHYAIV